MRRRLILGFVSVTLVVAACAGDDAAPTPTVSAALTEDVAPTVPSVGPTGNSTTTSAAPPSTSSPAPSPATTTTPDLVPLEGLELSLALVADGFAQPVGVASPPGDDRRFVVDQPGIIWVLDGGQPQVFLDIQDQVVFEGERGLLGLAFAPDFAESNSFFVDYTGEGGRTIVSEFTANGSTAIEDSERIVLEVAQPAANHNGGSLGFGPDGYLWISMGDGGGADDRFGNGQDPSTLLGALLRIDPTADPYLSHPDNPGGSWRDEIWAIGLRNPWRIAIDGDTLWIADVGQGAWEEVNRVDISAVDAPNFGWPRYEGSSCYLADDCDESDLTAPVYEYSHSEGRSITGGYVYRGAAIPELDGQYFLADFGSGWIRSIGLDAAAGADVTEWFAPGAVDGPTSFGFDSAGELYVTSIGGAVYQIVRS